MVLIEWFIYFIIYSFIGYIVEVMFMSILNKKIINRGFLCGPICPIYGMGAVGMLLFLKRYRHDYVALFIFGALIASVLEYVVSYTLEKVFHNKWWDYSNNKFNINGRVCLLNAFLFGLCSVGLIEFIHPFISKFVLIIPKNLLVIIFIILIVVLIADTIFSCIVAYNLRSRLIIVEELKNEKLSMLPNLFEDKLKQKVDNLKMYPNRLLKAFPDVLTNYKDEFDIMKKHKSKKLKK
ncbi:MAG: putative ABC transporter permease [Bacilli bacterium]|nr:putative ABC transporter permease [Bacilli bacterium]